MEREREGRGAALGDPGQGCGHQGGWRHTEGPGLLDLLRKSPEERESGEGEGGEGAALGDPGQGCGRHGRWDHTGGPELLNCFRKSPEERESGEGGGGLP